MITFIAAKLSHYLETRVGRSKTAENSSHVSGPLTAHLLTEGIITPALLNRLHEEWASSKKNEKRRKGEKPMKTRKNKPTDQ